MICVHVQGDHNLSRQLDQANSRNRELTQVQTKLETILSDMQSQAAAQQAALQQELDTANTHISNLQSQIGVLEAELAECAGQLNDLTAAGSLYSASEPQPTVSCCRLCFASRHGLQAGCLQSIGQRPAACACWPACSHALTVKGVMARAIHYMLHGWQHHTFHSQCMIVFLYVLL